MKDKINLKRHSRVDAKFKPGDCFDYGDRGKFFIEDCWYSRNKNEFCYTVYYPKRASVDAYRSYHESRITKNCKKMKSGSYFAQLFK